MPFSNCKYTLFFLIEAILTHFIIYRPGHYLKPGTDEKEGLLEILNQRLGPEDQNDWNKEQDWVIGDSLSVWWRPHFESYMVSKGGIVLFK